MRSSARAPLLAAALCSLLAAGCGVELEHGLDERQANQIAALLESNGIAADKLRDDGVEGWKIAIARGELAHAVQLLDANDLPRAARRGLGDTVADRGLLPSLGEEQARLEVARGAELERTLESVPGVLSARVHLALLDPSSLETEKRPARASVLLRSDGHLALREPDVQRLVAGAIAGLGEADVAVVVSGPAAVADASQLEPVGPLRVARGQKGRVVALAASGLALVVALGVALLLAALRLASLRGKRDEAHSTPSNPSG